LRRRVVPGPPEIPDADTTSGAGPPVGSHRIALR
jgi:hypothetical protein